MALRALGRNGEVAPRLKEAWAVCEAYRGKRAEAFETCSEFPSRAEADLAMASGQVERAIELHKAWLDVLPRAARDADSHSESFAAFMLSLRYRLLSEAFTRAGLDSEARAVQAERARLLEFWRLKLRSGNTLEMLVGRV